MSPVPLRVVAQEAEQHGRLRRPAVLLVAVDSMVLLVLPAVRAVGDFRADLGRLGA